MIQNPGEAKMKSISADQALMRRRDVNVLHIEALDGGFVVNAPSPDYGPDTRRIIPNADALASFVQRWATEAHER